MEERLIKAYIGDKATEIMNSNINWQAGILAMFIGPVWFFYRKAWLPGILYIVIAYFLNKFEFFNIESIAIILGAFMIFLANKIYICDARKKVYSIIKNNKEMKEEELIEIAKEKGGISISLPFIYIFLFSVLLIYFILNYISQYSYVFDRLKDTLEIINH